MQDETDKLDQTEIAADSKVRSTLVSGTITANIAQPEAARHSLFVAALIRLLPTIVVAVFIWCLLIRYDREVRLLLSRVSALEVGYFKIEIVQERLNALADPIRVNRAIDQLSPKGTVERRILQPADAVRILKRARLIAPVLHFGRIFWIDDHPESFTLEREFLQSLGIQVDLAQSNETARNLLRYQDPVRAYYDAIISDVRRDVGTETGLDLLKWKEPGHLPIIYYVLRLDVGIPAGAFGMTNYSGELFHLVFDALERTAILKVSSEIPNTDRQPN